MAGRNCEVRSDPEKCVERRRETFRQQNRWQKPWADADCDNCKPGRENEIRHAKGVKKKEEIKPRSDNPRNLRGPACPDCGKPRPRRKNVREGHPCGVCWRTNPKYLEERRKYFHKAYLKFKANLDGVGKVLSQGGGGE